MMTERRLDQILARYQNSFTEKIYAEENEEHDVLMDVFGLSPIIKKENRQYWGRELYQFPKVVLQLVGVCVVN
ncbi:hypothetical protein [Microcoleus sp. B3-D7]|uniref:hypothetical protein n=1 Tax=Microcoleus sp. B3-D7 TaxID=2818659 RepID=UPI002FD2821D